MILGLYKQIKLFFSATLEDYNDSSYIQQHDNMIVNNLWPTFVTIVKLYFIYGLILVILNNVNDSYSYNSSTLAIINYLLLALLPSIIIIYHHYIRDHLFAQNKIINTYILLVLVETSMQLYLYECMQEQDSSLNLSLSLITLICILVCVRYLKIRILILVKYFAYFIIRQNYELFQSSGIFHIIIIIILLIYFWDQQVIKLSKVYNFAEQSLKSVPSAVCILSYDCKNVLYSNTYMKKIIKKTKIGYTKTLTKSIRQDFHQPYVQTVESEISGSEVQDFFQKLYITKDQLKQEINPDLSKVNIQQQHDENEDSLVDMYETVQQIIRSDRKSQGKIYYFRFQYLEDIENFDQLQYNLQEKIQIDVRIKTLLHFGQHSDAILVNLYDISPTFKSAYYKSLNQFKSRVIRSISHELRTRLNIIQGIVELLFNNQQIFTQQVISKHLKGAYNNCRIQNFIISSIINYNLLKENKLVTKVDRCKLSDLIQDVIKLFHEEAEFKNISITFDSKIDSNNHELIDQEKFQSILVHVILNSLKYSKKNGKISIKVGKDKRQESPIPKRFSVAQNFHRSDNIMSNQGDSSYGRISLSKYINNREKSTSKYIVHSQIYSQLSSFQNVSTAMYDQYLIEIKDNGFGISQDKLNIIQDLLICEDSQFEKQTNDPSEGIMIGLRASNQIIKYISGRQSQSYLTIESIENIETVVRIHLQVRIFSENIVSSAINIFPRESQVELEIPIHTYQNFNRKNNPLAAHRSHEKVISEQSKPQCICEQTILIADDEPYNLMVLESLLVHLQQHVIKADNGAHCLQIMERQIAIQQQHKCKGLKAIIMDYQMPQMNGETAARLIIAKCKDCAVQPVPIFGLTGFSGEEEIHRLIEAGMKEVFIKPITIKTLEDLLVNIGKGEYRSLEYLSNLSYQFQCMEIDYAEDERLVNS